MGFLIRGPEEESRMMGCCRQAHELGDISAMRRGCRHGEEAVRKEGCWERGGRTLRRKVGIRREADG